MSGDALIFLIGASDWDTKVTQTPYIALPAALDSLVDYYEHGALSLSLYTLLLRRINSVLIMSHLVASNGLSIINWYKLYCVTAIDLFDTHSMSL